MYSTIGGLPKKCTICIIQYYKLHWNKNNFYTTVKKFFLKVIINDDEMKFLVGELCKGQVSSTGIAFVSPFMKKIWCFIDSLNFTIRPTSTLNVSAKSESRRDHVFVQIEDDCSNIPIEDELTHQYNYSNNVLAPIKCYPQLPQSSQEKMVCVFKTVY